MKFSKSLKTYILFIFIISSFSVSSFGQGGNKAGSGAKMTNQDPMPQKMNTANRDGIISPASGMMIFNTDCNDYQLFNGEGWIPVNSRDTMPSLGPIRGNVNPCMNATGEKYSVTALKGAVSYRWKVPPEAKIISGQGTTNITVDFGSANGAVYVTAYGKCWRSSGSYLGITLTPGVSVPQAGNHVAFRNQITWNWNAVQGALGYKISATNDYNTATDLGKVTSRVEKNLAGNTLHTRYLWAYFSCGKSAAIVMTKSTSSPVLAVVSTVAVNNITATEATVQATIAADGGSPIIARGICWSQTPNPTRQNPKTYHSLKLGDFERYLKNLLPNTTYYVRAYAVNSSGTAYGNELIFKTSCASYSPVGVSITASANPLCQGTPVTFCATSLNGGTSPSYQWRVNGTVINGATGATYSYTPAASNVVSCQLTSNAECVSGNPALSNTVNLSVNPANPVSVSVIASATQVCEGSEVNFTATAGNGGKNPAYQWKINGKNSEGSTSSLFTYVPANNDVVTCSVTSDNTCVTGNPASSAPITLNSMPVQPVSATISASANPFAPGSLVTFTATAVNAGSDVTYQWLNNGNVVGTSSNTYSCIPWSGDNIICMVKANQKCVKNNPAFSNNIIMTINQYFPTVTTAPVAYNQESGTVGGGEVASDGGSPVSSRGICWSSSPNPTISNDHSTNGFGTGSFSNNLSSLTSNSQYFVRAYATNSSGTAYGQELSFITLPSTTTTAVESVTRNSAKTGGNIIPGGGEYISSRGVCYSTKANPTIADSHTSDGTGTGVFVSNLTGLNENTMYYVRSFAKNAAGIVYGNQQTFSTQAVPETIITDSVTNISLFSARCGGKIASSGGSKFTSSGLCWSTKPNPTVSDNIKINVANTESFVSELTDLSLNTKYYVRTYATNADGTIYGNEVNFTTLQNPVLPVVTTKLITNLTETAATCRGVVLSDGGAPVSSYGVCWSTSPNPTLANSFTADGSGTGEFVSSLTGLNPSTHYYLRAYAVNNVGIAYGNEIEINKFQIGQNFGGGIIFYIDGTGQHGMIAAASDQNTKAQWGCYGTAINKTSSAIGAGQANTTAIVNGCNQPDNAAAICNDLVLNGFNDWFLPSKEELNLMYQKKDIIGGFSSNNYWSSTENEANFTWYQSFYDGYQYSYDKYFTGNVRAVRAF
jgi:hypothetical protein